MQFSKKMIIITIFVIIVVGRVDIKAAPTLQQNDGTTQRSDQTTSDADHTTEANSGRSIPINWILHIESMFSAMLSTDCKDLTSKLSKS